MIDRSISRSRGILGTLAGGELTIGLLSQNYSVSVADGFEIIGGSTLASISLGFLGNVSLRLSVMSQILQFTVFAYFFYISLPTIISNRAGRWVDNPVIRGAFVFGCLGPFFFTDGGVHLALFLVIMGILICALIFLSEDKPLGVDGSVFRVAYSAAGADEDRMEEFAAGMDDLSRIDMIITKSMIVIAVIGLFSIVTLIFGLLMRVVGRFFPLPELAILGWTLTGTVFSTLGIGSLPDPQFDIEDELNKILSLMFVNFTKTSLVAIFIFLGFFVSSVPFLFVIRAIPIFSSITVDSAQANLSRVGATLTLVIGLVLFASHGLWYWWRTVQRVPSYFQWLRDGEATTSVVSPVYATLPGAAIMIPPTFGYLYGAHFLHTHPDLSYYPLWISALIALAMIPGIALILLSVFFTRKRNSTDAPQPPNYEHKILPGGFVIQVSIMSIFLGITTNYNSIIQSGLAGVGLIELVGGGESLWLLFFGVVMFYYQDIFGGLAKENNRSGLIALCVLVLGAIAFAPGINPVIKWASAIVISALVMYTFYVKWKQSSQGQEKTD